MLIDRAGNILHESPLVGRLLGYEAGETAGLNLLELVEPEDVKGLKGALAGGPANGPVGFRVRAADGSLRHFEAVEATDGAGAVMDVRDVTERELAREKLRETETRYRVMVERMPVITYIQEVDGDHAMTFVSPQVEKILGYTQQDFLSQPKFELSIVHPDDRERVRKEDELTDATGEPFVSEYRALSKDGRVVWLHEEAVVVRDDEGRPLFWQGFMLDVTERTRAEQELRKSEERFKALVENSLDFVMLCNLDCTVRYASPTIEDVLGHRPEDLEGFYVPDLIHPEDRPAAARDFQTMLRESAARARPVRYRRKDGSYAYLEGVFSNKDSEPSVRGFVCNMRDVTEKVEADQELQRSLGLLVALQETGQALGATLDAEEICSRLVGAAERVARLEATWVEVWDEEGTTLVRCSSGPEELLSLTPAIPEVEAARAAAVREGGRRVFRAPRPDRGQEELTGVCLPFELHDRTIGVLEAYGAESLADDRVLAILESVTNQAATALENARLYGQIGERERRLQDMLAKLLGTQEEERRRVAYEVHDGLAQVAAAAHQHLQAFARRNAPEKAEVRAELDLVVKLVRRTVTDARRIIANLRPTALDDFGLSAALALEVEKLQEDGYEVEYSDVLGEERLPDAAEITLYRIAQESIANLRKHSRTTRVRLSLSRFGDEARLEVRDWGQGFDPVEVSAGSGPGERVGLAGMRERASMLGGNFEVRSSSEGTTVAVTIPIRA